MRVSPGGTATINGIRYQMLWCLLEAATLRLQAPPVRTPGTDDVTRVTLVLEPSRGGDASLLRPDLQQVVQLKARSGGGTWSLRDLVREVLPDLYRAVEFNGEQEFVFFTEGNRGEWGAAEDFFIRLATILPPLEGQPAAPLLDNTRVLRYRGSLRNANGNNFTEASERELFEQIVYSLRAAHPHIRADSEGEAEGKVWRLLSRLKFRWGETKEQLEFQLLRRLRPLVDNPDSVHDTLHLLLSKLMERAVRGNEPIDATEFFAENGLRGVPLVRRQWPRLVELGAEQTAHDLSSRFRYNPSNDVRPGGHQLLSMPPVDLWQRGGVECLAITGESGQGKSWRLFALASALAESDAPVAVVTHDGDAARAARDAAHRFWSTLCHRNPPTRLEDIARHLREIGAIAPGATWLYVLVDGVQTPQQALALFREIGTVDGVRLAFTAPDRVAERFGELPDAPGIVSLVITDFTEDETRRYVVGGDAVRWHDIRDEHVRRVIRRPLLAWIYRTLAAGDGWNAQNEYALYDGYLRRHVLRGLEDRGLFITDEPLLRAGLSLWDGETYPWSPVQMATFGFTNDLLAPCLELGFLARDGEGYYSIWHDRLKEWVVARSLAGAVADRVRTPVEIGERCHLLIFRDPWQPLDEAELARHMPFVPMDLIWHLAHRAAGRPSIADFLNVLLGKLEGDTAHYRDYESLYERLMPTVGATIAPALFRKLRESGGDRDDWLKLRSIKLCLASLRAEAVATEAITLLSVDDEGVRRAAAYILAVRPASDALPGLWQRYRNLREETAAWEARRKIATELSEETEQVMRSENPLWEEHEFWLALKACVPLSPDWVVAQIRNLPAPESSDHDLAADALITLLTYTCDGGQRWLDWKEKLRAWTAVGQPERTARCKEAFAGAAYVWRDSEEVPWLRARLFSDNARLIGPKCIQALSRIAPDAAVAGLSDLSPHHIGTTRRWALRYVLARRPEDTRIALAALILADTGRRWEYANALARTPQALTESSLNCLLSDLHNAAGAVTADVASLWVALQSAERVADLPLLRVLWRRGGEGWDACLAELLIRTGSRPGYYHDVRLETIINVLIKVGGPGFTRVVNHWLQADEPFTRLNGGILMGHLRPDAETVRLLEGLALLPDPSGKANADNKPLIWHSRLAQKALGRIGAWLPLIRSVVHLAKESHGDVINSRIGLPPLTDQEMAPALDALTTDPKHPGAILALGVGQRADWVAYIVAVLDAEDARVDNDVTHACQYALAVMPDLTPEAVDSMARRLPYTQGGWLLRPALMNQGSPASFDVLLRHLRDGLYRFRGRPCTVPDLDGVARTACFLLRQSAVRDEAAAICLERFSLDESLDSPAQHLVTAIAPLAAECPAARAALNCRAARDFLSRMAFAPDGSVHVVGEKARSMLGLAAYASDDAYAAVLRTLQDQGAHDQEYAPDLLLDIKPARAVSDLFAFLSSPRAKTRMRRQICLALAHQAKDTGPVDVRGFLLQKVSSGDARERLAACRVLGLLLPGPEVETAIQASMDDDDVHVFEVACEACRRLKAARDTSEIVDAILTEDDASRRWVLIITSLEIGELGDAHRPMPDWLKEISERLPPLDWDYVEEKIKRQREKRDKDLKWEEEHEDI